MSILRLVITFLGSVFKSQRQLVQNLGAQAVGNHILAISEAPAYDAGPLPISLAKHIGRRVRQVRRVSPNFFTLIPLSSSILQLR